MTKSITWRKQSRASETIKSEWKRRKLNKPRASSNGKVGQITSSRREISSNSKFWKPRDKINYSSLQSLVFKLTLRIKQEDRRFRLDKVKLTSQLAILS